MHWSSIVILILLIFDLPGDPVRPIDTSAWVQHTTAMNREYTTLYVIITHIILSTLSEWSQSLYLFIT